MPRGRPKGFVPPCRHCHKQFKRQEHLLRHERTHTNEKPFVCDCGRGFTRQDLLARHIKVSPLSHSSASPTENLQTPTNSDKLNFSGNEVEMNGIAVDPFWETDFMSQDLLPSSLFGTDFLNLEVPIRTEAPQDSNFAHFSSRLPSLDDLESGDQDPAGERARMCDRMDVLPAGTKNEPWVLSESCYEAFCLGTQVFSAVLPNGCSIPTKNTLIRCLEKCLRCVQQYLPYIHCATFQAQHKPPELLLAMAALGSRYLFETVQSYELYFVAKAILFERIRQEEYQSTSDFFVGNISTRNTNIEIERLQTFNLLIEFASWSDQRISKDAPLMASQLAVLVRESGIGRPDEVNQNSQWLPWVAVEERRRTLFAAYVLLNLQSIAFDTSPLIWNHEIGLCLPGYAAQWRATSAAQWKQVARQPEHEFQVRLRHLFSEDESPPLGTSVSSFANYILIQGLIQEMYMECHNAISSPGPSIDKSFKTALRRWQICWEMTQESRHDSNLDPLYAKGPFALTGAALLRLAYIRLSAGHSLSTELLLSRNPQCMLRRETKLQRSEQVNKAVIHAAHALSIPVRLGITFMTTTKTEIWSLEHSICSLESAVLLGDWLNMISDTAMSAGPDALQKVERRLLEIITDIIRGTCFAGTLDILEDYPSRIRRMAHTVTKIWATIFQGVNVLDIENVIGAGLQYLADTSLN